MKNKNEHIGELLLLFCALLWGISYIAQKYALTYVGPFTFLSARYSLASISLLPIVLFSEKKSTKKESQLSFSHKKFWELALLCGFINLTATGFVQMGLVFTNAGKAGFLTSVYIIIVPILGSIIYKKKTSLHVCISILLCIIGLYFLSFNGSNGLEKGDLIILCSTIFYAIHIHVWDNYANNINPLGFVMIEFAFAAIVAFFAAIVFEGWHFNNLVYCMGSVIFSGIFATGVCYSLQLYAQRRVNVSISALLMSTESVFAAIGGVIILNEIITVRELVGCIIIFSAILLVQFSYKIKLPFLKD